MKSLKLALTSLLLSQILASAPVLAEDCKNCGVVESVKAVSDEGSGSGLGLVAGGVVGGVLGHQIGSGSGKTLATVAGAAGGAYAGNEIEKGSKKHKVWKLRVDMDHGKSHTFDLKKKPDLVPGDRVSIEDGQPVHFRK
jgi:outer membrane lipoprotein SlyB